MRRNQPLLPETIKQRQDMAQAAARVACDACLELLMLVDSATEVCAISGPTKEEVLGGQGIVHMRMSFQTGHQVTARIGLQIGRRVAPRHVRLYPCDTSWSLQFSQLGPDEGEGYILIQAGSRKTKAGDQATMKLMSPEQRTSFIRMYLKEQALRLTKSSLLYAA
jgi:hypothetical protein